MQLKITYTDCNNDETLTSIQAEKYANVKLIRYDARSSDVPECFAVAVNIIAGETRVMGPLITFSGTHSKHMFGRIIIPYIYGSRCLPYKVFSKLAKL